MKIKADSMRDEGIDIDERPDGYWLVARHEADEAGPFDSLDECLGYAPIFRPCLAD